MEVVQVVDKPPMSHEPQILAIGKFDGIHIGHQAILHAARANSATEQLAVMSFWPHPDWVLRGKPGYDRLLTPFHEKCRMLDLLGVHRLYHVHFSAQYASTQAAEFVQEHLARLNVRQILVGHDFRFGREGAAGVDELRSLAAQIGVPVVVVDPVVDTGVKVSSSQIRAHLQAGRVEAAEALLGRPYSVVGEVIHGDALGRTLGFATANLDLTEAYVLPQDGVYAVTVELTSWTSGGSRNWFGVLNAGTRPTLQGKAYRMEVHLLNFEGDLYGQELRIQFLRRIRDEEKFTDINALKAQIGVDVAFAKDVFGLS